MVGGRNEETAAGKAQILVVCYGNICRSPVAEALLRRELEKVGLEDQYVVASAGVRALVGHDAARGMIEASAPRGLSLEGHRAQQLTSQMARGASVVIAMDEIVEEEIMILTGDDIEVELWPVDDPYGGADEGYVRAFDEIEQQVRDYVNVLHAQARVAD